MASLSDMTSPLLFHLQDGQKILAACIIEHPEGLVVFPPFWQSAEMHDRVMLIRGTVTGEGPWKIGKTVIRVLGCNEPELSQLWQEWQGFIASDDSDYMSREKIRDALISKGLMWK